MLQQHYAALGVMLANELLLVAKEMCQKLDESHDIPDALQAKEDALFRAMKHLHSLKAAPFADACRELIAIIGPHFPEDTIPNGFEILQSGCGDTNRESARDSGKA